MNGSSVASRIVRDGSGAAGTTITGIGQSRYSCCSEEVPNENGSHSSEGETDLLTGTHCSES